MVEPMLLWRLSSTPLGRYLDCPRKFVYSILDPKDLDAEAVRFGSLAHAYHEAYWLLWDGGGKPTMEQVRELVPQLEPGDYGGVENELADEELVAWVEEKMQVVFDSEEYARLEESIEEIWRVEGDVTPWNLKYAGTPCRGRLDLFIQTTEGHLRIVDWKHRSNLKHAPFSAEEFESNPQFAYYATLVFRQYEDYVRETGGIEVMHGNVLRDNGRVALYSHFYDIEYLEKMVRYFDRVLVPEMHEAITTATDRDPRLVKRDDSACFKYGKCPYYDKCPGTIVDGEGVLDTFYRLLPDEEEEEMQINSPEAPPEVQPVPVPQKHITVLDSVTDHRAVLLQAAGYKTLRDIHERPNLSAISGFGPKTTEKVVAEVAAYFEEYVE